jgi:hypothetical protein
LTLRDEVDRTVAALDSDEIDAATVALARAYADEIDGAAAAHARAAKVVKDVREELGSDSALYERVEELAAKLSARAALLAVGKQLQTLLDQMLATRHKRPVKASRPTGGALGELRAVKGGLA